MDEAMCEINWKKKIQYNQNKELDSRYPLRHKHVLVITGGQVHISSCFEKQRCTCGILLSCNSFDILWV